MLVPMHVIEGQKKQVAYVITKRVYGDFDIPRSDALGVSLDAYTAYTDAQKRNEKLSEAEKGDGVLYSVKVVPYF